ncbi:recombinase family protein [Acinetobacter baumannii]|nr:recombinase family protein [Acinetobacter baumannii]
MTTRIYVRVSTKDQNTQRALDDLKKFALSIESDVKEYVENESDTKLDRSILNQLLDDSRLASTCCYSAKKCKTLERSQNRIFREK